MNEEKFIRKCPNCNKDLFYSNKKNRNTAERKKRCCYSCSFLRYHKTPEGIKKDKELAERKSVMYSGSGNPFYGKKHSKETIEKIVKNADYSYAKTDEFREKSARPGKLNGMYGKSIYGVWVEKYGEDEARRKMEIFRKKQSINSSGEKNPMYGKPSPKGSGNGWGGWYKGWYFRSLRELSYMINIIELKKYIWESGDKKEYVIPYSDINGKNRTYRVDFVINKKILVEIKPKSLMNLPCNVIKKEAAIKFCKENNMQYRMVDVKIIDKAIIIDLYKSKTIKLNKKYKDRMEKIINGN